MNLAYRTRKNAEAVAKIYNKPLDKPDWFQITAKDEASEILIYDYIGWPFNDPRNLIAALADMDSVTVRINSPGGDVFDGMAIYNALSSHKGLVTTRTDSLAASMASVLMMAGKKREAYDNAMIMIHNSRAYAGGTANDFKEIVDLLEKVDGNLLNIYHEKSKTGKRELADMMKAETWLTSKEAKEKGFIDSIIDGKGVKAQFDLSVFANVPDFLICDNDLTERDAEKALRDAGFSRSKAKAMLAGRQTSNIEEMAAEIKKQISILGG